MKIMMCLLVSAALLVGGLPATAQQVTDYDPVLEPPRVQSRQFCSAAPECARMLWAADANGNSVKRKYGR